jgi:hypothetical protein
MSTSKTVRHAESPFRSDLVIPFKDRQVRLSRLGRDSDVLVNNDTGEIRGTHVTTFKRVDGAKFIKLFTQNIALTFDLKAAGIKTFTVLAWAMQEKSLDRDLVPLDKFVLDDFLEKNSLKMSLPTFWRGLAELEKAQIVAKHVRQGWYFINPNFLFNGDRIAFTQVIERDRKADMNTPDLFDDQPVEAELAAPKQARLEGS